VVETTVELAQKAGASEIIGRIVNELKDEAEPYRKMVMETITKVIASLGASDIDEKLEVRLVDGIIYSFQEQTTEDQVMLDGFGTVVNALGIRVKPYLTQIVSTILWRLNNKSAKVRQQAADLTSRLAVVIKQCGEDQLLSKLGLVLFEQLGEEYPDTLGSIIAAEGAIANVVGMTQMNPPVKDLRKYLALNFGGIFCSLIRSTLVPRMTPILRNRHEKVQEASINLIGRIGEHFVQFMLHFLFFFANRPFAFQLIAALNLCQLASGCVSVSSSLTSSRHTKRASVAQPSTRSDTSPRVWARKTCSRSC
jgi:splicing factor 3B subunit 1